MGLKLDPASPIGGRLLRFAAWCIRVMLTGLGRTYRWRIVSGEEHLERLYAEKTPVLFSFWHNRAYLGAGFFYHHVLPRGVDVTVLTSQSRDGELVAMIAREWGLSVVRGSSSRGGLQAMRAIHKAVKRGGTSPMILPDGPRGPVYQCKVGTVVLSQTSGAPVLPLGMAAGSYLTLRSWDRLVIPWPFSKVAVTVGEPLSLPRTHDSEALEKDRKTLETRLNDLTQEAEAAVGTVDPVHPTSDG